MIRVFLMVLSSLICVVAYSAPEKAELLLKNGTVISMEANASPATAVAIRDDKILWVGEEKEAAKWIDAQTKVIDVKGAFVYPGFIDCHAHIVSLGDSRLEIDLNDKPDKNVIVQLVKERVQKSKKGDWIAGRGWDQNEWPVKEFPTAADLDPVSPDNPVILERTDGHAIWVNSVALKLAGVTAATKDPDGGKVVRDQKGNPTGVFIDNAADLIYDKTPAPTLEQSIERTNIALKEAAQKGITMIHDAGTTESMMKAFQALSSKKELPVRIYSMVWLPGEFGENFLKTGPQFYSPYLEARTIKMVLDGAMGSRGGAMLEPYSDDPGNLGLLMWKESDLMRVLTQAKQKGIQVGIHAIGDRANRMVLDAYEKVGVKGLRWKIEHAQVLAPTDIPRFSQQEIIASMQPIHATADRPWAESRLGPERVKGAYAWRSLLNYKTIIAGGSDAPVEDINPIWGIYAAITRQDHNGKPEGGWDPEQIVTREEALRMYTTNAAYASFHENDMGTIKAGKLADIIVLPENLLTCDPKHMIDMTVLYTIVGGKIRYQQ
jgi:predicted amidohydrolase YtcJ